MITATIVLNITPLPENDVWFANAQAWNNYWKNISAIITIDVLAGTTVYVPVTFDDETYEDVTIEIDGEPINFVVKEKFDNLAAKVQALDTNYQQLRSALQDAGIIDNAQ